MLWPARVMGWLTAVYSIAVLVKPLLGASDDVGGIGSRPDTAASGADPRHRGA